jgi:hypothetical protein
MELARILHHRVVEDGRNECELRLLGRLQAIKSPPMLRRELSQIVHFPQVFPRRLLGARRRLDRLQKNLKKVRRLKQVMEALNSRKIKKMIG